MCGKVLLSAKYICLYHILLTHPLVYFPSLCCLETEKYNHSMRGCSLTFDWSGPNGKISSLIIIMTLTIPALVIEPKHTYT